MTKAIKLLMQCDEARMVFTDKAKTLVDKLKMWAKNNGWTIENSALKDAYRKGHFILRKYTETDPITEADLLDAKDVWTARREKQIFDKYKVDTNNIQKLAETINATVQKETEKIEQEGGEAAEIIRASGLPVNINNIMGDHRGVSVSFDMQRNDIVKFV